MLLNVFQRIKETIMYHPKMSDLVGPQMVFPHALRFLIIRIKENRILQGSPRFLKEHSKKSSIKKESPEGLKRLYFVTNTVILE